MCKKTNKNSLTTEAKNSVEIYPLTPIEIDNSSSYYCVYKAYKNRLAKVFKNNELTNIAISGYFGIGKSSVLKTFCKEESKEFLHISLIDFSNNNTDMHEQDSKFEKANELESALCRQIISTCRKKEFPKLRFQTVPEEISCPKLWGLIIFIAIYSFILLSSLFSNYISDFSHKLGFNFGGYGRLILYVLCIILTVGLVSLGTFYILKYLKIKEFGLKASKNNLEASASWIVGNESVLEKYRFDLIYDWTARKPYNFKKWRPDKVEDKKYTQRIFDKIWHKISRKHGQKASPSCYTKEYPPEILRSGVSDIVSGSVAEMVNEHPDVVQIIFDNLSDEFLSGGLPTVKAVMTGQEIDAPQALTADDIQKVDCFVNNAMDTLMNTVDYDNLVQVCREFGTPEDFSDLETNYPRTEFEENMTIKKQKQR